MRIIGASISFQLVNIFNILENQDLTEEQKKDKIKDYQASLTEESTGIFIGKNSSNSKNGYFVFGNVDEMSYDNLLKIKDYVDNILSSLTCEAEMKMSSLISGYDSEIHSIEYRFELADKVYNYAMSHSKMMRGHTLVWHKHESNVLDEYINDHYDGDANIEKIDNPDEFNKKRKELTKAFLAKYMKSVGERYPNCYCWDVINEIVPDIHIPHCSQEEREDGLRHSKWFEYLGKDFYIDILEIARDNLPEGTKLFYNEYGEQYPEKRKAIIQIINNIKRYEEKTGKVLLDGIGLQSHYDIEMTEEQIEEVFRDFSATGKEIQVTEMDVIPGYGERGQPLKYSSEDITKYDKIWKKVFECMNQYGITNFTGWGISDDLTWHLDTKCTMISENGEIKEFARNFLKNNQTRSGLEDCMDDDKLRSGLTGKAIEAVSIAIRSSATNEISKKDEIDEDEQAE